MFLVSWCKIISQDNLFLFLTFSISQLIKQIELVIFFLFFFPEHRIWHFMQMVSNGEHLHEISNPVSWDK